VEAGHRTYLAPIAGPPAGAPPGPNAYEKEKT
jgi:hypothetical protein